MLKKIIITFIIVFLIAFFIVNKNYALNIAKISEFIKVDQFWYQNWDEKIAIISDPQVGYNADSAFIPWNIYQVKNWKTNKTVFEWSPIIWKNWLIHEQSGDKVWWFDFSKLNKTGSYYIYDVKNNVKSVRFEINNKIYQNVLKASMRMFYYQRSWFEKNTKFAIEDWYTDKASHLQDKNTKYYDSSKNILPKDLSGGWYDAWDYNKYVNYVWSPILDLMLAYEQNKTIWLDNYGIPESNNSIPDILDEAKYELDWLLKMQNPDWSELSLVWTNNYEDASPPSDDNHTRFYWPATTQATYAAAWMFALSAIEFRDVDEKYSKKLQKASINAWNWANANPGIIFHNNNQETWKKNTDNRVNYLAAWDQESGNPEWFTSRKIFVASVYLFALTWKDEYKKYIDENYLDNMANWVNINSGLIPELDAALYYTKTKGATQKVKNEILKLYEDSIKNWENNYPSIINKTDAYRAYISDYNWDTNKWESIYDWWSNIVKARQSMLFLNMWKYNLDIKNSKKYQDAASAYVHYFHWVNPNWKTYLTNMLKYGAENSVQIIYHSWFKSNLPPPWYIPWWPNQYYRKSEDCYTDNPPKLCLPNTAAPEWQPAQKSWKDFWTGYPLNSWIVTEPQIYYQAAYVRMLSNFIK